MIKHFSQCLSYSKCSINVSSFLGFSLSSIEKELWQQGESARLCKKMTRTEVSCYSGGRFSWATISAVKGSAQPPAEAAHSRECIMKQAPGRHEICSQSMSHPFLVLADPIAKYRLLTPKTSTLHAKKQCKNCFNTTSNSHPFSLQQATFLAPKKQSEWRIRDRRKWPHGRRAKVIKYNKRFFTARE